MNVAKLLQLLTKFTSNWRNHQFHTIWGSEPDVGDINTNHRRTTWCQSLSPSSASGL